MKKILLTGAMALMLGAQVLMAVPAKRDVVHRITQPDGSVVELTLIGDENVHYYLTSDKMPVMVDAAGRYCYATVNATGRVVASDMQASNVADRGPAEATFVGQLNRDNIFAAMDKSAMNTPKRANQSSGVGLSEELFPHKGNVHALVILVQYPDQKFKVSNPKEYFNNFLNQPGFSENGGTGSVADYFHDASMNQFQPVFDVYGPVTTNSVMSTYGGNDTWGNDKNPGLMVYEACKNLDSEINFADYDTNGDGYVDNVYIIYAGQGEASYGSANTIWPHRWTMRDAYGSTPEFDGVKVNDYGCCNEWEDVRPDGIGTFCHEFSHVMGLPDLYHTAYGSGAEKTPGAWSVLDYGPYNNEGRTPPTYSLYERNAMEWIDPIVLGDPTSISLENLLESNTGCIVLTPKANEFFLIENRQQVGWDKYLPGHGMLVWHIDYNATQWNNNTVNNNSSHMYVDIEEAAGMADNEDAAIMATYTFPGTQRITSFTDDTKPSMRTWAGTALNTPITDITEQGGIITFDVSGGIVDLVAPVVTASEINGGGFTLSWDAVDKIQSYIVNIYTKDAAGDIVKLDNYTDVEVKGTSFTATRLAPATKYYATVASKHKDLLSEPSAEVEITTGAREFTLDVPQVLEAGDVTADGFTANWAAVEDATDYELTVIAYVNVPGETYTADMGTGNKITLPTGWSSSSTDYYGSSSTGYWGQAYPSLKLSKLGQYLATPVTDADIVSYSCWVRNAGSSKDNYFDILGLTPPATGEATDDDWTLLLSHDNISNSKSGETITVENIPAGIRQVKLVFQKVASGNMALDDVTYTTGGSSANPLEGYNNLAVGNVTAKYVQGLLSGVNEYSYTVVAKNAAGERSLESEPMTVKIDASGVADATIAEGIAIEAGEGVINVTAAEGSAVTVCDLAGRVLAAAQGSASFNVPAGFYIVAAGNTVNKVVVK